MWRCCDHSTGIKAPMVKEVKGSVKGSRARKPNRDGAGEGVKVYFDI